MLINTQPLWATRLQKSLQISKDMPESRFMQVATIDEAGFPQNRTLVFRHLDADNAVLSVISDLRTPKIAELRGDPRASICWYFTRSREQFRFACSATVLVHDVDGVDLTAQWKALSAQGKKQFLWGEPKTLREHEGPLHASVPDDSAPPPHFCQIDFHVSDVDYLNLKANPQYRELHQRKEGEWTSVSVIP